MVSPALPPSPPGCPVFGNLFSFSKDPLGRPRTWAQELGDIVFVRIPWIPVYLLSGPREIETVLVDEQRKFIKDRFTRGMEDVLGTSLLVSSGASWLRHRRLAAPAFTPKAVEAYDRRIVQAAREQMSTWAEKPVLDLHEEASTLSLHLVLATLVGEDLTEELAAIVRTCQDRYTRIFAGFLHTGLRLPLWVPTPRHLLLRFALRRLERRIYAILARRRASGRRDDLLDMLIEATDEDGSRWDDRIVRDELLTVVMSGRETISLALTYTWHLLARHPEAARRLRDEVESVLGGREVTSGGLSQLPYLDAVVKESLRLYPPSWHFGREAVEDCAVGGYTIPKGATVMVSQWAMHRDARYFAAPEEFRPERWLDGSLKDLPRYAYLPFGGGPRVCLGQHFANASVRLVVATVAQRYIFSDSGDHSLKLVPTVTLRPKHPVWVSVSEGPAATLLRIPLSERVPASPSGCPFRRVG